MPRPTVSVALDARGVATVTLDRPDRNNAYNGQMIDALLSGVSALGRDPAVRVVVLRGAGRHFQAGADLAWIRDVRAGSVEDNISVSQATTDAVYGLTHMPKPVIALVHGGCFGGGTGIVAACDVVIADRTAMFSITEARWGLTAVPIVPQLISRIGPGRLRRYALSCERFDAERAFEIGLVDEVCEDGALEETAAPIIDALLHCPPDALAQSKEAILKYAALDFSATALAEMARPHALKRLSAEADEGLASFLEKRKAAWYPVEDKPKKTKKKKKVVKKT
ncbi:MAG: enoyl-CoA hydratase-related protein [Pseudomonadota bacterium]